LRGGFFRRKIKLDKKQYGGEYQNTIEADADRARLKTSESLSQQGEVDPIPPGKKQPSRRKKC